MHTMPAFEIENNFQNYSIFHSNIFEIELIDLFSDFRYTHYTHSSE